MSEVLVIDEAWRKAAPSAIKASGYVGVVGYLFDPVAKPPDPGKALNAARANLLIKSGLSVRYVWETTAQRAGAGKVAGTLDRRKAERIAAANGYPKDCPIFYAVDFDADPVKVLPYFRGIAGGQYPVGVYGSKRVIEGVLGAGLAVYAWQTEAWSGTAVSPHAHLYQRVKHTLPSIKGVPVSSYDENVVIHPCPAWTHPVPAPKPNVDPVIPAPPPLDPATSTWFLRVWEIIRAMLTKGGQ